jgi:signal transduction histidine kinase
MQETIIHGVILVSLIICILGITLFLVLKKNFETKIENTRKILEAIIEAQEKERMRVAQDIHDELGGILTSMGFYASQLISNTQKDNSAIIKELSTLIDKAKREAKNASYALAPEALTKFGLKGAILELETRFGFTKNIHFEIEYNFIHEINQFAQLQLYRVIIELVNNAVKYAQPKTIYIDLFDKDDKIILQVKDDGIGFELEQTLNNGTANGLNHTIQRVKSLNGQIKQLSSSKDGSTFVFEFELKNIKS